MIAELYEALKAAGVDDTLARRAAQSVISGELREELVTKSYLKGELAELKTDIIRWNVGTIMAVVAIVLSVSRFLR